MKRPDSVMLMSANESSTYSKRARATLRLLPPSPLPLLRLRQSTPPIMVLLVTSDNEQFVVEKEVAERSVLIKNMLEGQSSRRATKRAQPSWSLLTPHL